GVPWGGEGAGRRPRPPRRRGDVAGVVGAPPRGRRALAARAWGRARPRVGGGPPRGGRACRPRPDRPARALGGGRGGGGGTVRDAAAPPRRPRCGSGARGRPRRDGRASLPRGGDPRPR